MIKNGETKSRIGTDSIFMAVTKLIALISTLLSAKMLSTYLSLTQYGSYSIVNTIVTIMTSITIFGLTDCVVYFYNSKKDINEKKKYVNTIFLLEIIIAAIFGVLVCLFSPILSQYFSFKELYLYLFFIVLQPLIENCFSMLTALYIINGKSKLMVLRNIITSVIKLCVICIAVMILKNLLVYFILILATNFIQLFLFWFWCNKINFTINPFNVDFKLVKQILMFGITISIIVLTNSLLKQIDKLYLGGIVSVEEIGIFENASKQLPFDIIATSLVTIVTPLISKFVIERKNAKLASMLKCYLTLCFASVFILAFPAILCSDDIILLLYSEDFLPGNNIFKVYTLVEIVKFCNLSIILVSDNKKAELGIVSIFALLLNLGLNRTMFSAYGTIGVAFSTLIVTLLLQAYLLIRSSTIIKTKILDILDLKRIIIILVEGGVLLLASHFLKPLVSEFVSNYILRLMIVYGCSVVILLILNIKPLLKIFKNLNSFSYGTTEYVGEK